jgi:hypothetical protein
MPEDAPPRSLLGPDRVSEKPGDQARPDPGTSALAA